MTGPSQGERLGPYRLEGLLGRGGMGVVYRAVDTRTRETVAVKVLIGLDPTLVERFRREVTVLDGVVHPNLVRTLALSLRPPRPYAVFEFVPGGTLRDRVERNGPLPWEDAVRVLSDVARGVEVAHARQLVHRDVKPENVLLAEGCAKLADFGLVKDLDRETLTHTGTMLGTPAFMAPEQVTSDKDRWGPTTDVYGLAATLFYALTGSLPFVAPTAVSTLLAVCDAPPPSARALQPAVPGWLSAVCQRGMAKANAERFPSAKAFLQALEAGAAAKVPPARQRPIGKALAVAATCLAVALLAAAGARSLRVASRDEPSRTDTAPTEPAVAKSAPSDPPRVGSQLEGSDPGPLATDPWARMLLPIDLVQELDALESEGQFARAVEVLQTARSSRPPWDSAAETLEQRFGSEQRIEDNAELCAALRSLKARQVTLASAKAVESFLGAWDAVYALAKSLNLTPQDQRTLSWRCQAIAYNALVTLLEHGKAQSSTFNAPRSQRYREVGGTRILRRILTPPEPQPEPELVWDLVELAAVAGRDRFQPAELPLVTALASEVSLHPEDQRLRIRSLHLAELLFLQDPRQEEQGKLALQVAAQSTQPLVLFRAIDLALEHAEPDLALAWALRLKAHPSLDHFTRYRALCLELEAVRTLGRLESWLGKSETRERDDPTWAPVMGRARGLALLGRWDEARELLTSIGKAFPDTQSASRYGMLFRTDVALPLSYALAEQDLNLLAPTPSQTPR